eukprot:9383129-Pyramimonas_sp.AAC.1
MSSTVLQVGGEGGSDPDFSYTKFTVTSPSFSTGSATADAYQSSSAVLSDIAQAWWTLRVSRRSEAKYVQMIADTI